MSSDKTSPGDHRISIYYDGDCPLCKSYIRMLRLRETVGKVNMINVRHDPTAVARFTRSGLNINKGFVVELDDRLYCGADAIHILSLLTDPSGIFNRINVYLFSRPKFAAAVYPLLVFGRAILLRILRRPPILTA